MTDFFEQQLAAGYMMPFLICPLDPALPSAFLPVGMIPTDLKYTWADLERYLSEIQCGLVAAGFGHVVPTKAADNPSVHRKIMLMSGNPRAFPGDREPGGGICAELLEGGDAILTLGAFRRKGTTIESVVTVDPPHTFKNATLQPSHLPRLLTFGNYVMLMMMLVAVRMEAGLLAADCNGSDPMDVGASERKMNVATRKALSKHPDSFGLLVYLWACASARAAWADRDPVTTPRMRVRWALDSLVFLRWWLDWIEVTGKPSSTYFISMETHAALVIMNQMLIALVLLWGRYFRSDPFAPWLVGSDQNEHFFSELRSFRINQPDWTFADVLRLAARFIYQLSVMTRPEVHLPAVFSKKGFNRSSYTPSASGEHVQTDWPTSAEIRDMYVAAIERVRPLIVALGAADELRAAGRWHAPSLEEWESIEKAIDAQETEQAQFERRAGERREVSESDEEDGQEDAHSEGDGQEGDGDASEEDGQHYPEKIVKDRLKPGQRAKMREYLIKWRGWSAAEADLTWEPHERLVEDGNAPLILAYLQGEHRRGRKLTIPDDLQAAADAEMGAEAEPEQEAAPPPPQPPIEPVDRPALIAMLIAPIGSEQPTAFALVRSGQMQRWRSGRRTMRRV